MRPFTSTISLEEARRRLEAAARPVTRTEHVGLEEAAGRVAGVDVTSPVDVPPFARSAMDGYAVVAADTSGASRAQPVRLRQLDRIFTGQPSGVTITPGTCAEIATGAPMPAGADAVVMVEQTARSGDEIQVFAPTTVGHHVGSRGVDIGAGEIVISAGAWLSPSRIGALAATGCVDVEVFAKPRVAILSTGDEVAEPGHALEPGQIFDVNRFTLGAIVSMHGGEPQPLRTAEDTIDALVESFDACAGADLIVFSGGSSVGERDLIVDAISARGEMVFHGVAIKPGMPTVFALVKGVPFFGMPGHPTSCLSNAYILLVPFLRSLARLPAYMPRVVRVPLGRRIVSAAGRHHFYTVRIKDGAALPAYKASGDITSLSQADGYIEIGVDQSVVEEGTLVDVTLF